MERYWEKMSSRSRFTVPVDLARHTHRDFSERKPALENFGIRMAIDKSYINALPKPKAATTFVKGKCKSLLKMARYGKVLER